MPRKRNPNPFARVTINLYQEDYLRCHELFANVGAAVGIRELVHQYVAGIDQRRARASEKLIGEIDIELPGE